MTFEEWVKQEGYEGLTSPDLGAMLTAWNASRANMEPVAIVRHHGRFPLNLEFIGKLPSIGSKLGVIE